MERPDRPKDDWQWALLVAALVTLVLGLTIRQEVAWYDSAETVVAAQRFDIAHQPGYPLYTLLAALWLRLLPFWSPAAKLSLLATISAAGAVFFALLFLRQEHMVTDRLSAAVALLMLAFAPILWNAAIVCEVYTFELFLLSGALWAITKHLQKKEKKTLVAALLFCGAALCHRTSVLALLPALLVFLGKEKVKELLLPLRNPKDLMIALLLFLLPFSSYYYLYHRLGSPSLVIADPKTPKSLATVFAYWTCADYRHALFPFGAAELLVRLKHFLLALGQQFPLIAFFFMASGLVVLHREKGHVFWALLAVIAVNSTFVAGYAAMEADTMMLPTLAALTLAAAVGLSRTLIALKPKWAKVLSLLLITWCATRGYLLLDRERLTGSDRFMEQVATLVPKGGHLLLSNDVSYRPYLYARYIDGKRQDLAVTVIDKLDDSNREQLAQLVRRRGLVGPILHPKNLYSYLREKFYLRPYGPVYHVLPNVPSFTVPAQKKIAIPVRANFADEVQLYGWQVGLVGAKKPVQGGMISLTYRWLCLKTTDKALWSVVLFCNEEFSTATRYGATVFHNIHRPCYGYKDTNEWAVGSHYEEAHICLIPPDLSPGKWSIWLGLVNEDDKGLGKLQLNELQEVNYLNYDGAEQVFRLTYGQRVGEPLWSISALGDLDRASVSFLPLEPSGARMIRLGELRVESSE